MTLGRQGQISGFHFQTRAVDDLVGEVRRRDGAEGNLDGQAGARLGRGGAGVGAAGDATPGVQQDEARDMAL
jgi:hypothetical protein